MHVNLTREGIKEREDGRRGEGGQLFQIFPSKGGDYSNDGYYSRKYGTFGCCSCTTGKQFSLHICKKHTLHLIPKRVNARLNVLISYCFRQN